MEIQASCKVCSAEVRAGLWDPPLPATRRVVNPIGEAGESRGGVDRTNHEIRYFQLHGHLRITEFGHAPGQSEGRRK